MQSKQTPISGLPLSAHMHVAHSLTQRHLSVAVYIYRQRSIVREKNQF